MNRLTAILLAVGLALMARAETRLGDVVMKDVVVLEPVDKTNLLNTVNALTNGAALGATALQPAATNGWTVGSHAGLATWRGATNAASDVVSSFAATGTVAHATSAARLAGSYSWQTVEHGTATVWRVSDDTTRVYIVSASVDFNGLAVGSVFDLTPVPLYFEHTPRPDVYVAWENEWFINDMDAENPLQWRASPAPAELPATLDAGSLNALGSCVIDYVPVTNSYALALHEELAAHNTNIRQAIDAIPLPPTNAVVGWLVWDSGSNRYWRVSATNLRFYVWGDLP